MIQQCPINEQTPAQALASRFGLPYIDLEGIEVDNALVAFFPSQSLFRDSILPLEKIRNRVRAVEAHVPAQPTTETEVFDLGASSEAGRFCRVL